MYKDNQTTAELVLQKEIESFVADEHGANQAVESVIAALEGAGENLYPHQYQSIFRVLHLLNTIQHVAAVAMA